MAALAETDTAMIAAEEASADHAVEIATVTATATVTTAALEDTAETEATAEATMIVATTEATTAAMTVKTAEATAATEVAMIAEEVAETTTIEVASIATQVAAMIGTPDPAVVVPVVAAASTEDTTAATVVATALHVTPHLLLVATVTPRRAPMPGTPTVVRAIPMFSTVIPTPPVMDVTEFSRCPLSNVTARAKRPKRQSARSRLLAPRPLCHCKFIGIRCLFLSLRLVGMGFGRSSKTSMRSWSFSAL